MIAQSLIQKKWHVVVTKNNQYKNAAALFEKLGYCYYLPLQKQLHYWSDRKKWINVPIFSPYIFLLTNEEERKLLFQSCNFLYFLHSGGKLAIAREEEIDNVRLLCNYSYNVKMEGPIAIKGDLVEVLNGPFSGMKGYVSQENGKNRLLIQILSLGQFASVDIESSWVKVCG